MTDATNGIDDAGKSYGNVLRESADKVVLTGLLLGLFVFGTRLTPTVRHPAGGASVEASLLTWIAWYVSLLTLAVILIYAELAFGGDDG